MSPVFKRLFLSFFQDKLPSICHLRLEENLDSYFVLKQETNVHKPFFEIWSLFLIEILMFSFTSLEVFEKIINFLAFCLKIFILLNWIKIKFYANLKTAHAPAHSNHHSTLWNFYFVPSLFNFDFFWFYLIFLFVFRFRFSICLNELFTNKNECLVYWFF